MKTKCRNFFLKRNISHGSANKILGSTLTAVVNADLDKVPLEKCHNLVSANPSGSTYQYLKDALLNPLLGIPNHKSHKTILSIGYESWVA